MLVQPSLYQLDRASEPLQHARSIPVSAMETSCSPRLKARNSFSGTDECEGCSPSKRQRHSAFLFDSQVEIARKPRSGSLGSLLSRSQSAPISAAAFANGHRTKATSWNATAVNNPETHECEDVAAAELLLGMTSLRHSGEFGSAPMQQSDPEDIKKGAGQQDPLHKAEDGFLCIYCKQVRDYVHLLI